MKNTLLLLCILLLTGCSTTFAYKNASWLIHWYLDDYIELTSEQEQQFDAALADWFDWHQTSELPKYTAHLTDILQDIENDKLDGDRIEYHRERARDHWQRIRAHVAPDLVELSKSLENEQIEGLFAALEKKNAEDESELEEILAKPSADQEKAWVQKNQKRIRRWLGRLNDEQRALTAEHSGDFAESEKHWIQYKRDYQEALKKAMLTPNRDTTYDSQLLDLLTHPEAFSSDALRQSRQTRTDFVISLYQLASPEQVQVLVEELSDLKDDITSLK